MASRIPAKILESYPSSVCLVSRFYSGLVGYAEPPNFLNAAPLAAAGSLLYPVSGASEVGSTSSPSGVRSRGHG